MPTEIFFGWAEIGGQANLACALFTELNKEKMDPYSEERAMSTELEQRALLWPD